MPDSADDGRDDRWRRVRRSPDFKRLLRARRAFITPMVVFFVAYYFALPVLVGWFPHVMETPVIGRINAAYLFALSQFFMAWLVMWLYVRHARRLDAMEAAIRRQAEGGPP